MQTMYLQYTYIHYTYNVETFYIQWTYKKYTLYIQYTMYTLCASNVRKMWMLCECECACARACVCAGAVSGRCALSIVLTVNVYYW